jgi:hypothetical protein
MLWTVELDRVAIMTRTLGFVSMILSKDSTHPRCDFITVSMTAGYVFIVTLFARASKRCRRSLP